MQRLLPLLVFPFLLPLVCGCFTGIEGTRRIELSRGDLRRLRATPEDTLLASMPVRHVGGLCRGDSFRITDDRIAYFTEIRAADRNDTLLTGRTIRFGGLMDRPLPSGDSERMMIFTDGRWSMVYPLGKAAPAADSIPVTRLPMLLDLSMVAEARRRLEGRRLWTRTSLGYDSAGERVKTLKFAPVTVREVRANDGNFPLLLVLEPDTPGQATFSVYMGFGTVRGESRTFPAQFYLSDPRLRHTSVSDGVWADIMASRVSVGMTKEECRLALGPPDEVDTGHDYSRLLDIWTYPDGTFLRFVDGRLSDFR